MKLKTEQETTMEDVNTVFDSLGVSVNCLELQLSNGKEIVVITKENYDFLMKLKRNAMLDYMGEFEDKI